MKIKLFLIAIGLLVLMSIFVFTLTKTEESIVQEIHITKINPKIANIILPELTAIPHEQITKEMHYSNILSGGIEIENSYVTGINIKAKATEVPKILSAIKKYNVAVSVSTAKQEIKHEFPTDRILRGLPKGNIAYNAPTTMELGKAQNIELKLSLEKTIDELKATIKFKGDKEGKRIDIADYMEAALTGDTFNITPATKNNQRAINSLKDITWQWEVVPNEEGEHQLHLALTTITQVEGKDVPMSEKTYDHDIYVKVTPTQWIRAFIADNKETAATMTALFGAVYAFWNKFFKKKPPSLPPYIQ